MERTIYRLLARVREEGPRLDARPVRGDLTSREVAVALGAGVAQACSVDGDTPRVRHALASVAWGLGPQASTPAIRMLGAATRGLACLATSAALDEGLRWLVLEDEFWTLTGRAR